MSIRLKIVASLITISLILIISYAITSQRIFENDKVSYIFEDQHNKVQNILASFHQKLDDGLWFSRFFSAYNKSNSQELTELKSLYEDQSVLSDVFLFNAETKETELMISKAKNPIPPPIKNIDRDNITISHIKGNQFLLTFPNSEDNKLILLLVLDYSLVLTNEDPYQYVLLSENKIISQAGQNHLPTNDLSTYFANLEVASSATTSVDRIGDDDYLISTIPSRYPNIRFASIIPKSKAFSALNELYNKTIIYIFISILVIFIVSYLLSHRITYRMQQLTKTAEQIGAGNFDIDPPFQSKDEVGTLANAFRKMGQEIKLLFDQKMEKDRMERELQTASLIQKQLFPEDQNVSYNDHFLSGYYTTSTECGGDWWYHFQIGLEVYIIMADATGHGIPAALVTSASKAIFSHIREYNYSLEDIARIWDEAVFQTSKGQIYMTAQICRYNLVTGDGEFVNLGHEMPVVYSKEKNTCLPLILDKNFSLGERSKVPPKINPFHLNKGESLVMYTDGILELTVDGTVMSERRFFKKVQTVQQNSTGPFDGAQKLFDTMITDSNADTTHLKDDVTLTIFSRL